MDDKSLDITKSLYHKLIFLLDETNTLSRTTALLSEMTGLLESLVKKHRDCLFFRLWSRTLYDISNEQSEAKRITLIIELITEIEKKTNYKSSNLKLENIKYELEIRKNQELEFLAYLKRRQQLTSTTSSKENDNKQKDIDNMSGLEFEHFLKRLFERCGYGVETTPITGDYGGDLVLSKKGIKTLVQAKHHTRAISIDAVQQIVAAKRIYDCQKCLVISNSTYTKRAIKLAIANNVSLWDINILESIIDAVV